MASCEQVFTRSAMKTRKIFAALLLCGLGSAAIAEGPEEDFKRRLQLLEERSENLRKDVATKMRLYHQLQNGAGTPQFVWQDKPQTPEQRDRLAKLLNLTLRDELQSLAALDEQRTQIQADIEWLHIQKNETSVLPLATTGGATKSALPLDCSPLLATSSEQPMKLLQDFGPRTDHDTGVQWSSVGWWLAKRGNSVRACADGVVAYSGHVTGRGVVVMLDHGEGRMTLYGNLTDDAAKLLPKGKKVAAGTLLGSPRDRFYFEVRQNGQAVNPRTVFPTNRLEQLNAR